MKKVLVSVVAIVMVFSLVACGGGSGSSASLAGTYKMTSIEAAGVSMDVAQFAEATGVEADLLNLVLNEDGSFEMSAFAEAGAENVSGTWKASGNTVTLTVDGEDMTATVDGNKLTIEETQDGQTMKIVFEK